VHALQENKILVDSTMCSKTVYFVVAAALLLLGQAVDIDAANMRRELMSDKPEKAEKVRGVMALHQRCFDAIWDRAWLATTHMVAPHCLACLTLFVLLHSETL
jgi:hypothetical protein